MSISFPVSLHMCFCLAVAKELKFQNEKSIEKRALHAALNSVGYRFAYLSIISRFHKSKIQCFKVLDVEMDWYIVHMYVCVCV